MKFVIELTGAICSDAFEDAAKKAAKAKKVKPGTAEYEAAWDAEECRLLDVIRRHLDGEDDGDRTVRLEFDDEAKTVRVLPKRRKK